MYVLNDTVLFIHAHTCMYYSLCTYQCFLPEGWGGGGDSMGIRPIKSTFSREFDGTLRHRDGTLD